MSPFMFRFVFAALVAVAAASTVIGQVPGTCSPPGTATCDPNGNPIDGPAVPGPVAPDPGAPEVPAAITVHSLTSIVPLGGGLAVKGAEGIAIDPVSGLAYIGLNGTIVSGCEGDPSLTGVTGPGADRGPGRDQMSIVDPSASIEVAAVPTGEAPIWPTIDANRGVVYMMGSGGAGTVTVHDPTDGRVLQVITVGGKPHMGGLDLSRGCPTDC